MTNTRLYHLIMLILTSLAVATACFFLGGVVAEATNATPIMGITFKTSGALAGFLISFVVIFRAYKNMGATSLLLKVAVVPKDNNFVRAGNSFRATSTVLNTVSGTKISRDIEPIWEAGNLTVHLRDVGEGDLVMIVVSDSNGGTWQSDFFSPVCPKITLI